MTTAAKTIAAAHRARDAAADMDVVAAALRDATSAAAGLLDTDALDADHCWNTARAAEEVAQAFYALQQAAAAWHHLHAVAAARTFELAPAFEPISSPAPPPFARRRLPHMYPCEYRRCANACDDTDCDACAEPCGEYGCGCAPCTCIDPIATYQPAPVARPFAV